LTALKTMFHRLKHNLSHDETLPLAQQNLSSRKFAFCKLLVYSFKSAQLFVSQRVMKNFKKWRFFDRTTLSWPIPPVFWAQNSNNSWQSIGFTNFPQQTSDSLPRRRLRKASDIVFSQSESSKNSHFSGKIAFFSFKSLSGQFSWWYRR